MATQLITPPAAEPVLLPEAKSFLRVDTVADDAIITSLIASARQMCEAYTNSKYVTQTWRLYLDAFPIYLQPGSSAARASAAPASGAWAWAQGAWGFTLPFGPVQSIVSLNYLDGFGTKQALLSGTAFTFDVASTIARIFPALPGFWPVSQYAPNSVSCDFVCGFPADGVPESISTAILMQVRDWYDSRGVDQAGTGRAMTPAVEGLLWPYRDLRF